MLSKTMEKAINQQINAELYSAYMYLSMAAYAEEANFSGFAHWMKVQAQEEQGHAMKFFDHLVDRGGRVILEAIEKPPVEWDSLLDMFEKTLQHEQHVTSLINELYTEAVKQQDYASQVMLQWFVEEQVEEEASAGEIVETLRLAGDHGNALIMLDRALGQRGD